MDQAYTMGGAERGCNGLGWICNCNAACATWSGTAATGTCSVQRV
jgi:hypothetical protein